MPNYRIEYDPIAWCFIVSKSGRVLASFASRPAAEQYVASKVKEHREKEGEQQ